MATTHGRQLEPPKIDIVEHFGEAETAHHEILHRLIGSLGEVESTELHRVYDELAPVIYLGLLATPITRRRRRTILLELEEEGLIEGEEVPKGCCWRAGECDD